MGRLKNIPPMAKMFIGSEPSATHASMLACVDVGYRSAAAVSAAVLDRTEAARTMQRMHGPHRIPTLLQRAARFCRED